jgi:hypothetical protein
MIANETKPCGCTVLHLCKEAQELREHVASLSFTADGTGQVAEALAALTAHRRAACVVPQREERTVCPAGHVLAEVGVRAHGRYGQAECRECERGRRR